MRTLPLLLSVLALSAHAADPEPYLVEDVGVRVDLPKGWEAVQWTNLMFRATTRDSGVLLFAWGTPTQAAPVEAELDLYVSHWVNAAQGFGLTDAKAVSSTVVDRDGVPTARAELELVSGGAPARMYVASFPSEGWLFHIATVSSRVNARRAERSLDELLARLDVKKPAKALELGGFVEADGVRVDLPDGWRPPLEHELAAVRDHLARLPVSDTSACSKAIRPRGPATPDLMITCHGGAWLGIVDEHTFTDKEQLLRPLMFGEAPIQAGIALPLSDRTGFLYEADAAGSAMAVAVVPYDQGVARTWVLGQEGEAERLKTTARDAMATATFSGAHPVDPVEWVTYWPAYRPTHPGVLGSLAGCLCSFLALGGGALALLGRRRRPAEDWG